VSAVGPVTGETFHSGSTGAAAQLQVPDASVFDYYRANGTQITSVGMSGRKIENILLSPQTNPFGSRATNAKGIYWLDCNNESYAIQNCRIVGTLVLLNCGGSTVVGDGVVWEPASPELPSLLVQGQIAFTGSAAPLSESTTGINLNPTGVPYSGVSNANLKDTFRAAIKGLVYVSGNLTVSGESSIDGQLTVGGRMGVTGSLSVFFDDRYYYSPPPGFRSGTVMTLVPGSFVQVVR
jgi:hypothetical protein